MSTWEVKNLRRRERNIFEKKICGTQEETRMGYLKRQKGKGVMVERHTVTNEFV